MDSVLSIILGICLAAACGFRVFVPFLAASVAVRAGALELTDSFVWIGSEAALAVFAAASIAEVVAYYVPWFDSLLDAIVGPAAVIAGVLLSASVLTDMSPALRWSLALIAGGGTAGIMQGATTALRAGSTVSTAGLANPAVATGELVAAAGVPALAIAFPIVCFVLLAGFAVLMWRAGGRLWPRRRR